MSDKDGESCIYCSTTIDACRGAGDHVIPAALGRFRDDLRFRFICRDCNGKIGSLEETLLRSAPEALFRRFIQGAIKPTGRGKRGSGWSSAKGGARPKGTVHHDNHTELVDISVEDPENVKPIDQLVVHDTDGVEHHLRLFPEMSAESLRRKIKDASTAPGSRMYLYADDQRYGYYTDLLAELYPGTTTVDIKSVDAGIHQVQGLVEFCFSSDYYRALAKIAFHYYLVVNRRGFRGDESEFADIRHFIMEGGEHAVFFEGGGARFINPFRELPGGGALLAGVWGHSLAADEEERAAVVNIMLFVGPKHLPSSHHVRVAQLCSPLVIPGAQYAHQYVYNHKPDEDGFSGFVSESSVTRLR